jgi:hypothetical protein
VVEDLAVGWRELNVVASPQPSECGAVLGQVFDEGVETRVVDFVAD